MKLFGREQNEGPRKQKDRPGSKSEEIDDPKTELRSLRKVFHPDVLASSLQQIQDPTLRNTVKEISEEIIRTLNSVGDLLQNDPKLKGDWDSGSRSRKEEAMFLLRFTEKKPELSSKTFRIGTPMDFLRHTRNFVVSGTEPSPTDYTTVTPDRADPLYSWAAGLHGIMAEIQEWHASRRQFETPENERKLAGFAKSMNAEFGIEVDLGPSYISILDRINLLGEMARLLHDLKPAQREFWRGTRVEFESFDKAPPGVQKSGDAELAKILIRNDRYFRRIEGGAEMKTNRPNLNALTEAMRNVLSAGDSIASIPKEPGPTELWWVGQLGSVIRKFGIDFNITFEEKDILESTDVPSYIAGELERDLRWAAGSFHTLIHRMLSNRDLLERMQGSGIIVSLGLGTDRLMKGQKVLVVTLRSKSGEESPFKGDFQALYQTVPNRE